MPAVLGYATDNRRETRRDVQGVRRRQQMTFRHPPPGPYIRLASRRQLRAPPPRPALPLPASTALSSKVFKVSASLSLSTRRT
ncbi:hypothetical protein K525DRAFT_275106 [Schizophyllum commune Loenen D]|nr:hypothetical protein K525DRAFT_275106 [Schizophyllum commune Loenen D]